MPPEVSERRAEVRAFMEEHVYPNEAALGREDESSDALIAELRAKAKAAGIWAPHLPPEAGGTGSGFIEYALLNEEIGRSMWAQLVFNCQAPDAGNGEILHMFGTDEQKERFLRPLVEGTARSFFSMTEPEVSGADPTELRTTAVQDGDEWVINGHKWFSSSAEGAAFGIVMAVTDPDAPPHRRMSQILVPTETPGYELIRPIPVMGHAGRGWSTHCEVRYTDVRVPLENVLGEPGDGFRIAQKRLGPGRIHHVMRWLGQMQRAFELMCAYSLERHVGGVAARREADRPELDRRLSRRDPGVPAAHARRGSQARRGRRGAGRGLPDQVLRRPRPERGHRPRDPGARSPRAHRRDAARRHVRAGPRRPDLRRPGRGAPDGRQPPDPQGVPGRRHVHVRLRRALTSTAPPGPGPVRALDGRTRLDQASSASIAAASSSGLKPSGPGSPWKATRPSRPIR